MALIPSSAKRRYVSWVVLLLAFFTTCASVADELEPVADQPAAEDFSLIDLDGQAHQLSAYAGKVVLVSFWATWCPECIFEMPSLEALSNTLPDHEFIILAINVGEDQKLVRSFAEQHNLTFPILLDHNLAAYKKWPVLGVPTSFVINQSGKIVYSVIGALDWTNPVTVSKIRAYLHSTKAHLFSYQAK
jgi:peroxiredoxin